MKIVRSGLLAEMIAFSQKESGVIVGDPGAGKTYILSILVETLLEQEIPATMIRMDFLSEGTDTEITQALGIAEGNWIDSLKKIMVPDKKRGVLVFDSFDSVRDEKLKSILLNQFAKAKQELPNWSIVVSVRTYDAAKSQKLIDLFVMEFNENNVHCRHFTIPILSEEELALFLSGNDRLKAVYHGGSQKLKDVLKIPFFLSLLHTILKKTDVNTEALKLLKSEIDLLELYWTKVILRESYIQTELFLMKITQKMVYERLLTVDKLDYLRDLSPQDVLIAEQLLSVNILAEQNSYSSKIAYTHNILFDYAVSKLILKDDAGKILEFIAGDQTRPYFLRPSFVYLFARIWYADQTKFWSIYNELSLNTDPTISLFNKLIPSSVIAREFEMDIKLEFLDGTENFKTLQISNVLQALRFTKNTTNILAQAYLLHKLSSALQLPFVVDFAFILDGLINNSAIRSNTLAFAICGQSARNLMDFLMPHKENPFVERLASYQGTIFICKTFSTDIRSSRTQLKNILDTLKHPNFNINYISTLAEGIKEFYKADPDFCVTVYHEIFDHEETSTAPAPMLSGVLMSFTSSRRDQFGTCYFRLTEFFPTFINDFPNQAIPLGLHITNNFINRRNGAPIKVSDFIKTPFIFDISGVKAHYQVDLSHIWSVNCNYIDAFKFTRMIIDYLGRILDNSDDQALRIGLKLFCQNAYNAYNWKMLLDFASIHPEDTCDLLFQVLLQPAILYWDDTVVAAGAFLEATASIYDNKQLLLIEKAILALPDYVDHNERPKTNAIILRLLGRIPRERIRQANSISLMSKSEKVANDPLVTYSTSVEAFTTQMFLEEQGVDVNDPMNEKLLAANHIMESFASQFLNDLSNRKSYEQALEEATTAYTIVKNSNPLSSPLSQTLLSNIAAVCKIVLRSENLIKPSPPLNEQTYATFKDIILFCLEQHTDSDIHAEDNYSPGSGFSHTPRSQAAAALTQLFIQTRDEELLPLIKHYSADRNPITRFGVLQSLPYLYSDKKELFWEIMDERLANETDWFTKGAVISMLDNHKIFSEEPDRFIKSLEIAKNSIKRIPEGNNTFLDNFLLVVLTFIRTTTDLRAKDILNECLDHQLYLGFDLVYEAFKIIEPENIYRNYADAADLAKSQKILDILMHLLERCERILTSVQSGDAITKEVEQAFKILDSVITRIYFSLQVNKRILKNRIPITRENQQRFYFFSKPLLEKVVYISRQLDGGHVQAHSAHYIIEILSEVLSFDTNFSLATMSEITLMAAGSQYTFDDSAIRGAVRYTEKLLADHKAMLNDPVAFGQIMTVLNIYVKSGWIQALELLWKLDDIFR